MTSDVPRARARLAALLAFVLAPLSLRCTVADPLPEGVHQWGRYELCLARTSDTCHAAGEGCRTSAFDATRAAFAGVDADAGVFYWSRGTAAVATGTQVGRDFTVTVSEELADVCGCPARVTETIRGTFLDLAPAVSCTGEADGGCGPGAERPDAGTSGETGLDLGASYEGLRGTVTAEVVALDGGAACKCTPCRVEYQLTGKR